MFHTSFKSEREKEYDNTDLQLDLTINPLLCSTCAEYEVLQFSAFSHPNISCMSDSGPTLVRNVRFVQEMEEMCEPISWNDITSSLLAIIITFKVFTKLGLNEREKKLKSIRQGNGAYEFVVFLSMCCDDANFVKQYVLQDLQQSLANLT